MGMGPYPLLVALANSRLGFLHRAGRYRPGDHRFHTMFVGVADLWKDSAGP